MVLLNSVLNSIMVFFVFHEAIGFDLEEVGRDV